MRAWVTVLLAASSAHAWSTRDCSTNASLQPTYPNGGAAWPLVYLSNMPSGGWARGAVEDAMVSWNSIVGATDNLSIGGGGYGYCTKPDNAGQSVIGWDNGTCHTWSANEVGVCIVWTSSCTIVKEVVYFNSDVSFSAAELESTALHELGHYQNADHDWYEVSIMGYGAEPMVTLTAADHQFLRTVWPSTNSAAADLYLDRYVLRSPVLPGQESWVLSPPPTCSGGCSSIDTGDTVSVKLSYGNAGKTSVSAFFIEMRLGPHVIGTWSVTSYPAHAQDIYQFIATVPPGVPPGNYTLTVEIDPNGLVSQSNGPTSGEVVSFSGFTVPAPPGWTCSLSRYNALDGCDCSCGVADPDCTGSSPVARGCGDANSCTDDRCSASGTCVYSNNSATCDDGLYCTVSDRCSGGACALTSPRNCSAQTSACSVGQCDEAANTCARLPVNEGGTCDDGRYCTVGDTCGGGQCTGAPRDCSALSSQCAVGTCSVSQDACVATPAREGLTCTDASLCTMGDTCRTGVCSGTPRDCSMLNGPCVRGQCDPATGGCIAVPLANGATCSDGAFCTVNESCTAGVCGGGVPRSCATLDSTCTLGTCNETADQCQAVARNEAGPCDDGQYCSTGDVCVAGVCRGVARDCSSLNGTCQRGTCDEAADACRAVASNEGGTCDDGAFCTVGDRCTAGACRGAARSCSAGLSTCQTGRCDEPSDACITSNVTDGTTCDDGAFCTVGDRCVAGACTSGLPRDCSAPDSACWVGVCNETARACASTARPDGTTCSDGFGCSEADVCLAGTCTAGRPVQCAPTNDPCQMAVCQEPSGQCAVQSALCGQSPAPCGCSSGQGVLLLLALAVLRRQRGRGRHRPGVRRASM